MKLPNAEIAVVERGKIVEYLLNPEHPGNGGKAAFFASLGFSVDEWDQLANVLRELARTHDVAETVQSPHGCKYSVEGRINGPAGQFRRVRTVWIVEAGEDVPRLVTAFPRRK